METQYKKLLKFNGDHGTLVGLRILNNILKAVTLGLYYPWARASILKYMYGESEFMGSRFVFHGTGKELFKGFIRAVGLLILVYIIFFFCLLSKQIMLIILGSLFLYVFLLGIIPIAIHSSYRYRLSRSSWRGIHFGYRGKLGEFFKLYLVGLLLTAVTFGIYTSWFQVSMKKYIYTHIRFGNVEMDFKGDGLKLFIIKLKGFFLSIITLGIYFFWYLKERVQFEIDNTVIIQNGRQINLRTSISAGKIFGMIFINNLIIIFTFGIGTGIAINRAMRTAFENIEFDGEIDPDHLLQTEEEYKDATGEDIAGMLDIPLF